MGELVESGAVTRRDDRTWVVLGAHPDAIRNRRLAAAWPSVPGRPDRRRYQRAPVRARQSASNASNAIRNGGGWMAMPPTTAGSAG